MKGDLQPQDIVPLMQDTFRFVAGYEGEVPGAAPQDCGNYLLHDLPMANGNLPSICMKCWNR